MMIMRVRFCRRHLSTPSFSMALKDVSKALPSGRKLFDRVHLNFMDGAKIGLIGPNGAGKSSLLKIVGKIQNDGFDGVRFFRFHLRLERHTHSHTHAGGMAQERSSCGISGTGTHTGRRIHSVG